MLSNIKITLTRDSVCMGDDADDHTKIIKIALQSSSHNTIMKIAEKYLPHVAGNGHLWDCILNGINIAVIKGNCLEITCCADVMAFSDASSLYFRYHSATY